MLPGIGIPVLGTIDKLIDLGSELIADPDKRIEFQFKALELQRGAMQDLLATQTIPWVDALVKILGAVNMFSRPVGSAMMTAFGAWCHYRQIPLDSGIHILFDGAFPSWGMSRHLGKQQEQETARMKVEKTAEIEKVRIEQSTYPVHWGKEP